MEDEEIKLYGNDKTREEMTESISILVGFSFQKNKLKFYLVSPKN